MFINVDLHTKDINKSTGLRITIHSKRICKLYYNVKFLLDARPEVPYEMREFRSRGWLDLRAFGLYTPAILIKTLSRDAASPTA